MGVFIGGVKMSEDLTFITNEKGNKLINPEKAVGVLEE